MDAFNGRREHPVHHRVYQGSMVQIYRLSIGLNIVQKQIDIDLSGVKIF